MYIALYRKWRPRKFEDICGQEHITLSLKNQIKAKRISHAYLFCGTRGTGKTSTAKILAKAVNCLDLQDGNPCENCNSCNSINEGNSIDVFEIDAASNRGIDSIRDLRDAVKFTPVGKYKLYIIDEVHMLTNEAFNALLKTLEEPPAYVIFVLATTEPHKLPATILSRCQRFDFKRINQKDMEKRLKHICKEEEIKIEQEALQLIIRNSDGAMRDAINTIDQCSVYSNKDVNIDHVTAVLGIVNDTYLFDIAEAITDENIKKSIGLLKEISDEGKDMQQLAQDLQVHYRNLLMAKIVSEAGSIIDLSAEKIDLLNKQSKKYTKENIIRCINILSTLSADIKWSSQPLLLLEVAIVKMGRPEKDISNDGLLARLARLEKMISQGEISIAMPKGIKETKSKAESKKEEVVGVVTRKDEGKKLKTEQKEDSIKKEASINIVIDSWPGFIKELGKRKRMIIMSCLASCKPMLSSANEVSLYFEKDDKFLMESLCDRKNKKEAEDMAEEYFGIPIKIKPMLEEEIEKTKEIKYIAKPDPKNKIKEEMPDTIDEQYVIDKAIEVFGENVVQVVKEQ